MNEEKAYAEHIMKCLKGLNKEERDISYKNGNPLDINIGELTVTEIFPYSGNIEKLEIKNYDGDKRWFDIKRFIEEHHKPLQAFPDSISFKADADVLVEFKHGFLDAIIPHAKELGYDYVEAKIEGIYEEGMTDGIMHAVGAFESAGSNVVPFKITPRKVIKYYSGKKQ